MRSDKIDSVIQARPPRNVEMLTMRILISIGLLSAGFFFYWLIQPENIGNKILFGLLAVSLLFKLLRALHEWYHYFNIKIDNKPELKKAWSVDILTTYCSGEPYDMIVSTLQAMVEIEYPHTNYLCDEADDPYLKSVCERLGVIHVTRDEKIDAKAGNINNALKQAKGEIAVILDPDHQPHPRFLHEVLPYFNDKEVGYVQSVQPYKNPNESFVARGAAEQTYQFYGPLMMAMNGYNTAQAIGANCAFRREALDSIGGHAAGLSEDMHTAMLLHAKGWKSKYVPVMLTRGLVPSSLSAYYKQQLKWSRGTFDLLFYKLPKLLNNLSWRQKLHYLTLPIYFLFGFITLIDIFIPVLGLILMDSPLKMDSNDFLMYMLPFVVSTVIIRLYSQKWTLEDQEKGFHLVGGILYSASWWVFITGFIYTIFKINVPYIPTPKENKPTNEWLLSSPSLLIALISLITIVYGLSKDWNPYSLVLAGFAGMNVLIFFSAFIFGLQKVIYNIKKAVTQNSLLNAIFFSLDQLVKFVCFKFFLVIRNSALPLVIILFIVISGFTFFVNKDEPSLHTVTNNEYEKYLGGFYIGWNHLHKNQLQTVENQLGRKVDIENYSQAIRTVHHLKYVLKYTDSRSIPLIKLDITDLYDDSLKISDNQFSEIVSVFKNYGLPVMVNLDTHYLRHRIDGSEIKLWQDFVLKTRNAGLSNITWVWDITKYENPANFYPGKWYVDWISIDYDPEKKRHNEYFVGDASVYKHPMLITNVPTSSNQLETFLLEAASSDDIKGFVFEANNDSGNHINQLNKLLRSFEKPPFYRSPTNFVQGKQIFKKSTAKRDTLAKQITISNQKNTFGLKVGQEEFYIKGICYNPEHDWRDYHVPLNRPQLEKDFQAIKAMGANTIRRYEPGPYDKNILNIAQEYELKVLFGFWFDPQVDYLQDSARLEEYSDKVIQTVKAYKDHPAILAWGIGNETWGLLKKNFSKPYLSYVRRNYIRFLNELAHKIHEIDPSHPVFTAGELVIGQTESEVHQIKELAPEIDFVGINSYYEEQISRLDVLMEKHAPTLPYFISEFGPDGYWDAGLSNFRNRDVLVEESSFTKARKYTTQWNQYIESNKGKNLGGAAFCWSDRMEGSATWFGIVDDQRKKKPAYYALKSTWTNTPVEVKLPDVRILGNWYDIPTNTGFEYSAVVVNDYQGKLSYRWYLCENNYLDRINTFEVEEKNVVELHLPEQKKNYRLYVHVTDTLGNVVTASKPINAEI